MGPSTTHDEPGTSDLGGCPDGRTVLLDWSFLGGGAELEWWAQRALAGAAPLDREEPGWR